MENTSIAANLFRGAEAVGGKLHFSEVEMVFKSHAINIQTGETRISYSDIAKVGKRQTLLLVPNGMLVVMKDGKEYKFVIWNRKKVIAFIESRITT